jgi:hypothetical protein
MVGSIWFPNCDGWVAFSLVIIGVEGEWEDEGIRVGGMSCTVLIVDGLDMHL